MKPQCVRRPDLRVALVVFVFLAWMPSPGHSQQTDSFFRSDPPQTYVQVRGPLSYAGRAEIPLRTLPAGEYRLVAQGPGLASSRLRFQVDGRGLTPRPWSGPQALLKPPGLEHLSRAEGRGWFHLGVSTFGGALWGLGFRSVSDAEDRIQAAQEAVAAATDADALELAQVDLADARTEKIDEGRVRDLWAAYFVTTWVGAGLEAWLLTPQATLRSNAAGATVSFPRATGSAAAGRSLLVPGAGQRYLGHTTRANVFTTLVAASAAGAILAQDYYLEARRREGVAEMLLDLADTSALQAQRRAALENAQNETDSRSLLRWVAAGAAAYFYVWNVVDAYRLGNQVASERSQPLVSLAPLPDKGLGLQLSWGFD